MGFLSDFTDLFKSENSRTTKNRSFVEDYANSPFGGGFNLLGKLATGALNRNLYAKQTFATSRGLKSAKDLAPITGYGILKGLTTDTGDATSRVIQDTFLGGRGKSGLFDDRNKLFDDPTHGMLSPINFVAGNLVNNSDFNQMIQPGDIIPTKIVVKEGIKLGLLAAKSGKGVLFNSGKKAAKEALAKNARLLATAEQIGKVDVDVSKLFSAGHGRVSTVATDLTDNADSVVTLINHEPVANGGSVTRLDDNSFSDVQKLARRTPDPKRVDRPDEDKVAFEVELRMRLDEIEAKGPRERGPGLTVNGKPYERKARINPDLPEPDPRDWTRMTDEDVAMYGHPPDIQWGIDTESVQLLKQVENGWAGANNILGDMANPNMPHILGNKDFEEAINYYRATMRSGDPAAKRAFESLMDAAYHNTDTTINRYQPQLDELLNRPNLNEIDETLIMDLTKFIDEARAYRAKLDDTVRHYNELEGHPLLQGTITENFWGLEGHVTPEELKFLIKEHGFTEQQLNTLGTNDGFFSFNQIMRKINNGDNASKIVSDALSDGSMDDVIRMAQSGDANAAVNVAEFYDLQDAHVQAEEYWQLAAETGHPDGIQGWYDNQMLQADQADIATRDSGLSFGGMGRVDKKINEIRKMIKRQYTLFKSLKNHPLLQEYFFELNFESTVIGSLSGQDLSELVTRYTDKEIIDFAQSLRNIDMKDIKRYEELFDKANPGVKPTGEDILAYSDNELTILYNRSARPYSGQDISLKSVDDVPASSFRNIMDTITYGESNRSISLVNSIRKAFDWEPIGKAASAYIYNTIEDTLAFYASHYSLTARNVANIRKYVGVPGAAGRILGDDLSRTIISQSAETRKIIIAVIDDLNGVIDRVLSKDYVFENPIGFNTSIGDALDKGFDTSDLVIHSIPGHDAVVIGVSPTSAMIKPLSSDDVQMINRIDDQLKVALESQVNGEYVDDYVFDSLNYQRNDFIKFNNMSDTRVPIVDVGEGLPSVSAESVDDMLRNFEDALNHPSFINDKFAVNDKILRKFAEDLENMDYWDLPRIKKNKLKKFFKKLKKFLEDTGDGTYLPSGIDAPMPPDSGVTGFGKMQSERRQQEIISEALRILEDDGVPDFGDLTGGLLGGRFNGITTAGVVPKSDAEAIANMRILAGIDTPKATPSIGLLSSPVEDGKVLAGVGANANKAKATAQASVKSPKTLSLVSSINVPSSTTPNGLVAIDQARINELTELHNNGTLTADDFNDIASSADGVARGGGNKNRTDPRKLKESFIEFVTYNKKEDIDALVTKEGNDYGNKQATVGHVAGDSKGSDVEWQTEPYQQAERQRRIELKREVTPAEVYEYLATKDRYADMDYEEIARVTATMHIHRKIDKFNKKTPPLFVRPKWMQYKTYHAIMIILEEEARLGPNNVPKEFYDRVVEDFGIDDHNEFFNKFTSNYSRHQIAMTKKQKVIVLEALKNNPNLTNIEVGKILGRPYSDIAWSRFKRRNK